MGIGIKTKMALSWPRALWVNWRIRAYAKRYKNNSDNYTLQQRNDWLVKKAKFLLWLWNIKVEVEGYQNLPKSPAILVPNHKSYADPVVLLYALKKQSHEDDVLNKIPTFVGKKELQKQKSVHSAMQLLDSFFIDSENFRDFFKTLNEFGKFVKENRTYGVIFPEGTRVGEDGLGEFKNGAFKVAHQNFLAVVPVAISDTREAFNHKRKKKLTIKVTFLPQFKANTVFAMDVNVLAEKAKEAIQGALANGEDK
ncbi:lysophospholipid acyltransferase family protein [Mycoplasmopsis columbinasalis]|uniref:1-acyl-sn-glycerol-3-phosphate acyltransferase n=1 Tax=Mycoplasmopsis columbinasalis TaxID=114880 RepID=A0A449BAB1_9BACT|nr:lysophospholipid acyltransferase family protein [Mycoplasmopsis columbinasalis]VEU78134.1 1-acyl-sn-glycerol-3-phosphate acyltransferase [Mycoplasmopsis columbinasalis]